MSLANIGRHSIVLRFALLAVLGGAAVAFGLLIRGLPADLSDHTLTRGVNEAHLADAGIVLLPADGPPKLSRGAAERLASSGRTGLPALGSAFGRMATNIRYPAFEGLVWVVSLDPAGYQPFVSGPAPLPGQQREPRVYVADYVLVVLDADTGSLLFGTERSHAVD